MVAFEPRVVVCTSIELYRFPISIDLGQIQFTLWLPWSHKNNQNRDIKSIVLKARIISLQVLQQSMVNDKTWLLWWKLKTYDKKWWNLGSQVHVRYTCTLSKKIFLQKFVKLRGLVLFRQRCKDCIWEEWLMNYRLYPLEFCKYLPDARFNSQIDFEYMCI